jgi:uncharacterized protein
MQKEINNLNKVRVVNTIVFVVFCFAIGEVTAILLTGLIYNVNSFQIFETLKELSQTNRSSLILFSLFSTLFRFIIIPGLYLALTNKTSLSFLWINGKVHLTPMLLTILIVVAFMPCTSILIDLNGRLEFPVWLSKVEAYFRTAEEKAYHLRSQLFVFRELKDLMVVILIVAIIPGIAEEFFFRGIVQSQLHNILKNHHYTIFLSAIIFSSFHFQFYGFIPRMVLGMVLGYIFYWSNNIWYPVIMHITNNVIGVVGVYLLGPQIPDPHSKGSMPVILIIPSIVVSILIILNLKRILIVTSIPK